VDNVRKYGDPPFIVAVIHGGPGAAGMMAPVARELSKGLGVLEPLQAATSVDGQVQELRAILEKHGQLPVILVGHSWGAWLSMIFAARYPSFVKKLILVGSGPLEEKYALKITGTRFSRLSGEELREVTALTEALNDPGIAGKNKIFARFGKLMSKADTLDPLPGEGEEADMLEDVFRSVWAEAEEMRRSGELLKIAMQIRCPVVAIHGDYDPHPAEGVEEPLRKLARDFRLILLKDCGHEPWKERAAKEKFYRVLKEELA
jgi:pimeloyl-ACP methyl ester carboxylesterase